MRGKCLFLSAHTAHKSGGKYIRFCVPHHTAFVKFYIGSEALISVSLEKCIATNSLNRKTSKTRCFPSHRPLFSLNSTFNLARDVYYILLLLLHLFVCARFCTSTLIHSVFTNLLFCKHPLWRAFLKTSVFVRSSMNDFAKTDIFLSIFLQQQSSVNMILIMVWRRDRIYILWERWFQHAIMISNWNLFEDF